MRSLSRTFSAIALAALVTIAPASAASAAKKAKPAAWAKKHHLTGAWRTKDADRDGLKNLQEYKLATNPSKADSDRDGLKDGDEVKSGNNPLKADTDRDKVKDGAEHAGVLTAFDGEKLTIRQFNGAKLTATLDDDADCVTGDDGDDDTSADDSSAENDTDTDPDDGGFAPVTGDDEWVEDTDGNVATADTSDVDAEESVVDLGEDVDAEAGCDRAALIKKGAVLRSAELETRGGVRYIVALEFA